MTIIVPRHGAPGPNSARWAGALGESLAKSIVRLESSPTMIDSSFRTALLHVAARCTVDPRAAELETWEAVVSAMQLAVGKLLYPPMEMFHRIVRQDHAGFNRALAAALQWHKEYWSDEERALTIPSLVALAPLAIACFAHDAGIPIEVESEYLPATLLGRNWCGEFRT